MYVVTVHSEFSAAHRLLEYDGNCEHLHGHNWKVEISFATTQLNPQGLAIDFRVAKEILGTCINELDHRYLNDVEAFTKVNPSCENIARHLYEEAQKQLMEIHGILHVRVDQIKIWESSNTWVTYRPESL